MLKSMLSVFAIATSVVLSPYGIDTSGGVGNLADSRVRALAIEDVCAAGFCDIDIPFKKCCLADDTWRAHTWCESGPCNIGSDCPGMEQE